MQRTVRGRSHQLDFDEAPQRHIQVAEMVLEKAKRLVEHKRDVVVLLDSITRLARAYNAVTAAFRQGPLRRYDANALQRPRRFFAAARNVEEAVSLTIIRHGADRYRQPMDDCHLRKRQGSNNS